MCYEFILFSTVGFQCVTQNSSQWECTYIDKVSALTDSAVGLQAEEVVMRKVILVAHARTGYSFLEKRLMIYSTLKVRQT